MLAEQGTLSRLRYRMIVKVHKTQDGRKIVAICDDELIGKKFEEGKLQLDLNSSFYKGEEMGEEKVVELVKGSCIVNIVGKKSMDFALKLGIVDTKNIIKIENIPHAQAILE